MRIIILFLLILTPYTVFAGQENTGTNIMYALPLITIGTLAYLKDKEGAIEFGKSFLTNIAVTGILKEVTHQRRPNGGCCKSFPSGHTSVSFQSATFIHKRYGLKYAVPAYIAATYVGYTRVVADKHYTKDVVAGAVLGIASSWYFTTEYRGFLVTPIANTDTIGLSFSKQF